MGICAIILPWPNIDWNIFSLILQSLGGVKNVYILGGSIWIEWVQNSGWDLYRREGESLAAASSRGGHILTHAPPWTDELILDQMDQMHLFWIKWIRWIRCTDTGSNVSHFTLIGVRPLDHCKRIVRVDIGKHTKIKANNFVSFSSPLCRVMDGSSLASSLQASSSGQVSGMLINSHTGSKLRNIFRVHSWHFSSSSRKERFGFFHSTLFWSGCFLESARGTHQLNS